VKKTLIASLIISIVGGALSGCSSIPGISEGKRIVARDSDNARSRYYESLQESRPVIVNHPGNWIVGSEIGLAKAQPEILSKKIFYSRSGDVTLQEIATWLSSTAHIPVVIDPSTWAMSATPGGANGAPGMGKPGPMPPASMAPATGFGPSATMGGGQAQPGGGAAGMMGPSPFTKIASPSYDGTLSGMLDWVAAQTGVYWDYRDGVISIFKTQTRTFQIPSVPAISDMMSMISTMGSSGGGSSGGSPSGGAGGGAPPSGGASGGSSGGAAGGSSAGGAGGGGTTTMTSSSHVDFWSSLKATAQSVAGYGAQVVDDQSFGTITVTGTPAQVHRVDEWVKSMSALLTKQIAIDVHIYNVQVTQEDNYGLNLKAVENAFNVASSGAGGAALNVAGVSLPNVTASSTPMAFGASILNGPASGTNVAVQALSTLGKVTQVFSRSGVTLNGQMLALQSANVQNYLASSQTTIAANVGNMTTLQPGTVTTGFTGSFLPKVMDDKIFINFNVTISNLISLTTFTTGGTGSGANATGGSSIQLPDVASFTLQQMIGIKPGQTLVLTGYRQHGASSLENGTGVAGNPYVGGGVDTQKNDNMTAVVITAKLL
jgi:type IVB pilus formation R64 PilN family outer membrane protein